MVQSPQLPCKCHVEHMELACTDVSIAQPGRGAWGGTAGEIGIHKQLKHSARSVSQNFPPLSLEGSLTLAS